MSRCVRRAKYVVDLSAEERAGLEAMIGKGRGTANRLLKARLLLKADTGGGREGWDDGRIADALETSASTVCRTRRQLVEEGLEAALSRRKHDTPRTARLFGGESEAMACPEPPGGQARWSLRLPEKKVVEPGIVEAASDSTIQRVLEKTHSNRTGAGTGSSRRKPAPLSSRRWRMCWRSVRARTIRSILWSASTRPRSN